MAVQFLSLASRDFSVVSASALVDALFTACDDTWVVEYMDLLNSSGEDFNEIRNLNLVRF